LKHRLFTAIRPPPQNIGEIVAFQKKLIALNFPVSWESPEKIHLTLNYLGRIDDASSYQVKKMLRETVSTFSPFELRPFFLETLYQRHEPSIIYLSAVGNTGALKEIRQTLCDKFVDLKIPQPERFLPHLTLGRMQRTDPVATKAFLDKITTVEAPAFSPFQVDEIVLYKSLVSKIGSHYQIFTRFPFDRTP
jgi:2'-5' RNA ligase